MVYIESMASGRPVVTAENGGAYELINESNGYLAEPDDPHSLAEAMKKMIETYAQFDCKGISEKALASYSEDSIARAYEALYKKVLK